MPPEMNPNQIALKPISPKKLESFIRSFRTLLILGGCALLLFSGMHFNTLLNREFSSKGLYDVLSNFLLGLVFFLCVYLLNKRSATLVYVYGVLVVFTIIAAILFGSWLNLITIIIELAFWMTLYVLKLQGELK
jgi:hypothetical protein